MARLTPLRAHRLRPDRPGGAPADAVELEALRIAPRPAAVLRAWLHQGLLHADERPGLYVLEVERVATLGVSGPARSLVGLLSQGPGVLELEEDAPRALPTEPIPALVADDQRLFASYLEEASQQGSLAWESHSRQGTYRLLRVFEGNLLRRLEAVLADAPVRPLRWLPPVPSLAALSPLSDADVGLRALHRGLRGLTTFEPQRFLTLVREYARVEALDARLDTEAGLAVAREKLALFAHADHAVLMVLPGGEGKLLRFRAHLNLSQLPAAPRNPTLRSLDLALLNALVLKTVLGLDRPDEVGHPHVFTAPSLELLVHEVDVGHFQAGFALNPPPIWEVRAVMEAQQQLPARTLRLATEPPEGAIFYVPDAEG